MVEFYMILDSTLRVPSRFWEGESVQVAGDPLPFIGKDGLILGTTFEAEEGWDAEEPDGQAWLMLHALWTLAGVAESGEMTLLVVGDLWREDVPDLHLWRVSPGRVEVAHVQELRWEPWREDAPSEEARWWKGMAPLIAAEPLMVDVVRAFEPTLFRLPEDVVEAAGWLWPPYVAITPDAFDHLAGQGADIFRTPGGVLVILGRVGRRRVIMPISPVRQEILEG